MSFHDDRRSSGEKQGQTRCEDNSGIERECPECAYSHYNNSLPLLHEVNFRDRIFARAPVLAYRNDRFHITSRN